MSQQMKLYRKKAKSGVCVHSGCSEKAEQGRSMCLNHLNHHAGRIAVRYDQRLENHECVQCGVKLHAADKKSRCRECLDKAKEYKRRHHERQKAKGLCILCPRPATVKDGKPTTRCEYHMDRVSESSKRLQAKRRADARWAKSVGVAA